eukprot:97043_1
MRTMCNDTSGFSPHSAHKRSSHRQLILILFIFLSAIVYFCIGYLTNWSEHELYDDTVPILDEHELYDADCLIIILGQTRAYQLTYHSFEKYLLIPSKCHLALCVGTQSEHSLNNPFYQSASYVWTWNETQHQSYEEAFEYLFFELNKAHPHLKLHEDEWKQLYQIPGHFLAPITNEKGSGAIQIFFRQFLYLKIKELGLINKYKYLMYTRSDYKYLCEFPFNTLTQNRSITDKIWIAAGGHWSGVSDRNLLTSNKLFMHTLDIALDLFLNTTLWLAPTSMDNIEQALKFHFENKHIYDQIEYYQHVMYEVRGNNDWTRWSKGTWDKNDQLFVKYPPNYQQAMRYC